MQHFAVPRVATEDRMFHSNLGNLCTYIFKETDFDHTYLFDVDYQKFISGDSRAEKLRMNNIRVFQSLFY